MEEYTSETLFDEVDRIASVDTTVMAIEELLALQGKCLALKQEACEALVPINAQIQRAKAECAVSGTYSDADWYRRVNTARRCHGRLDQKLALKLTEIRLALRGARVAQSRDEAISFERRFISAAKRLLSEETFAMLCEEAKE